MKKVSFFILTLILIFAVACKGEKKETETEVEKTEVQSEATTTESFVVKPEATSVKWTAYKTTEKTAVDGIFTILNFENKSGTTPQDALNNLNFSIPVSSLFTKDESRDAKLKTSFFGEMLDTVFLKGTIKYVNDSYIASITMNGVTYDLPLDVKITDERRVRMKATMQLKDWNALGALLMLSKACFDLHKGLDGVSKTWEEVAIEINTYLRKS